MSSGLDPVVYVRNNTGLEPDPWQAKLLRSKARRKVVCCARQVGKSTITGSLLSYTAESYPGSTSVLIAPALRQSLLLFEKVHGPLDRSGVTDEKHTESERKLANGSKVVALPGSNPRTVLGFGGVDLLVIDEAANTLRRTIEAVLPFVLISKGQVILLSTPEAKQGAFYEAWKDPAYEKYHVTAYDCPRIAKEDIDQARGEHHTDATASASFKRFYLAQFTDLQDALVTEADIDAMWDDPPAPLMDEDDDILDSGVEPMRM